MGRGEIWSVAIALWMAVFACIGVVIAIFAGRVMAAVQGTPAEAELEQASRFRPPWIGAGGWLGYHPLNQRLWSAIARADDLPAGAQRLQRTIRFLLLAQYCALAALVVVLFATART